MANFVAIPVGKGDAFYLRRDDGHTVTASTMSAASAASFLPRLPDMW